MEQIVKIDKIEALLLKTHWCDKIYECRNRY